MDDPIFWLGLSVGLVAAGLFAVVVTLVPAVIQLGRAAQSVERFFDTLLRELPPTLEALRLTTLEVSEIADSVDEGVKGAGQVVKQVGQSLEGARSQARGAQVNARSAWAGLQAAWKTFREDPPAMAANRLPTAPPARPLSRQSVASNPPLPPQSTPSNLPRSEP
ncbi:MAG: DUF948 domain-containing protein [Cyanobacteriota bacterium]|nr:DUF948 domain-containing protein [Cyanobacteriota bacterium]